MRQDFRFTLRLLRRQPLFGSLLGGTLAVGMTAAITIFTICDRVLLKPLPYPDPARVVSIGGVGLGMAGGHPAVPRSLAELPEFASVGLYGSGGLNLGSDPAPLRVRAAGVSAGFFPALATPVLFGRAFDVREEMTTAPVVVLGYDLWHSHFAGDRSVVGQTVLVNSRPFTILGVMPPGFAFPDDAEVWTPAFAEPQMYGAAYGPKYLARLGVGVSIAQARAAIDRMNQAIHVREPRAIFHAANVVSLQDRLAGPLRPTLLFLAGLVSLLLIATCANVGGLILSRLRVRQHELLIRAALGASRVRLATQLLVECLTITGLGAVVGVGAAMATLRGIAAAVPDLAPDANLLTIDGRFLAIGLGVATVTGALFALMPMLSAGRRSTAAGLREAATSTARLGWLRSGLVAGQVATAFLLLTATSATLAVMTRLSHVNVGFANDHALLFQVTLPAARYGHAGATTAVGHQMVTALAAVPTVTAVGLSTLAPGSHDVAIGVIVAHEGDTIDTSSMPSNSSTLMATTPGYFRAMGIRVLAGHTFDEADETAAARVVVLGEQSARTLWGSAPAAIGEHVLMASGLTKTPQLFTVIGVVDDVRMRGVATAEAQTYLPFAVAPPYGGLTVAIATTGDPSLSVPAIQRTLAAIDPSLPLYDVALVRDIRARFLATEQLTVTLTTAFGLVALALSAIGLYGVLSQAVSQRTRELGIRLALGANPIGLTGSVVRSGLGLTGLGLLVGGIGSGAALRFAARFVPTIAAPSSASLALDGAVLVVIATLAAWIPARRAARVSLLTALRTD